jgi:hypothetical protein
MSRRIGHPVLGLARIPGHPEAERLEHARRSEPAPRRHAAVLDHEHARSRSRRDQTGRHFERRSLVHAVVRRGHAHDAGQAVAGDLGLVASGAREARQLFHRHTFPAQRDQERADLDLALGAGDDRRERAVSLVEGEVAPVPAVGAEHAQEVAEDHRRGDRRRVAAPARSSRGF